ncbi:hypothetical protein H2201_003149 [Coniosporium apollinis]|uniref:EamA domain-containing protein n=1 Tax=Coniosporium apollinis TaxID=61459 RepID=A0ABQ9NZL1_9PEZI|nr:hypothetical protein H2201_003149 [Coniosporium apollinis]
MGELSAGASVAVGVVVGVLSTSIQSIGLTLQRKSHLLEDEKEEHHTRRPPYRRRRWQLGMLMFIVANLVGSTIQITTLPLPVLSTLQASGLVFNSICATLILSEPFTRYSLAGTLLVTTGAILIGTFGALTEPSHNLDQLLSLLSRQQFLLWLGSTFFLVALIVLGTWVLRRLYRGHMTPRVKLVLGMCFGFISGVLSAHSLLVAKSAVELLVRTIVDRHNQFNRWQSWMILLGLVALALSQLYYLHRGLKLCSTSVLYPFVFCIYNIIAILDGLIYFRQTSRLPVLHAGLIAVGTVILLSGVMALSWRLEHEHGHDHDTGSPVSRRSRRKTIDHPAIAPQSVLTPGMGLVESASSDTEDADEQPLLSASPRDSLDDEEAAGRARKRKRTIDGDGADDEEDGPSEQTPLLNRSATTASASSRSSHQLPPRHPTALHTAIAEERSEIWDELNDLDDHRRVSLVGPARPASSASLAAGRRRSGARGRASTLNIPSARRTSGVSWWERPRRIQPPRLRPRSSSSARSSRDDGGLRDEEEDDDFAGLLSPSPTERPGRWGRRRRSTGQEPLGGWFKLGWWKRRRREGDGDGGGDGGGDGDGRDEGGAAGEGNGEGRA